MNIANNQASVIGAAPRRAPVPQCPSAERTPLPRSTALPSSSVLPAASGPEPGHSTTAAGAGTCPGGWWSSTGSCWPSSFFRRRCGMEEVRDGRMRPYPKAPFRGAGCRKHAGQGVLFVKDKGSPPSLALHTEGTRKATDLGRPPVKGRHSGQPCVPVRSHRPRKCLSLVSIDAQSPLLPPPGEAHGRSRSEPGRSGASPRRTDTPVARSPRRTTSPPLTTGAPFRPFPDRSTSEGRSDVTRIHGARAVSRPGDRLLGDRERVQRHDRLGHQGGERPGDPDLGGRGGDPDPRSGTLTLYADAVEKYRQEAFRETGGPAPAGGGRSGRKRREESA